MKTYLLTYGDKNFYISKKHLISLANRSNFFDYTISLGPKNLSYEFKKKYANILNNKRGGGYWIWKHHILFNLLRDISDGDIVIYCDAGASINLSEKATKRYFQYISMLKDSDFSNLRMNCEEGFIEKYYTKKEIFEYFDVKTNSKISNSLQLQAGHMFFEKNKESLEYFKEYESLLDKNPDLITDSLEPKKQLKNFKENRHDQSIFSFLSKIRGSLVIQNETEFRVRPEQQYAFPFLSVRSYGHGPKDYVKYILNSKKFTEKTIFFNDPSKNHY